MATKNVNKSALEKMVKARSALILDQPFFGSLALRLKFVEDSTTSTLKVDGRHIYYNPEFIASLSFELVKSAQCHEVMHCVLDHIQRCGPRNRHKWNYAIDYVVNPIIKDAGFALGEGWLYDEAFFGMTADRVYNLLPDPPPMNGSGGKKPGNGQPLDEIGYGGPDAPKDESEREQQGREWKIATIQAANSARLQGLLPNSLERFLGDLMKPQVNWVERLKNFVNETMKDDYNWKRPNRRFIPDVYLPSLHNDVMGDIAVFVDDSGSISMATLMTFGAEIRAIMQDVRPKTTRLIFCDAAIPHDGEYDLEPDDDLPLRIHGGGGTDFRPPFARLEEREIIPKCAVYLTDLNGPFGEEPPYPVLWVCINDNVAPWGDTIHIDEVIIEEH